MAYTAYVSTKNAKSLTVRNAPLGDKVDSLSNGSEVIVRGESVPKGNWNWVEIGDNRWVALEYLTTIRNTKVIATRSRETIGGGLRVYKTRLIDSRGNVVNRVRLISGRVNKQTPSDKPNSQTPPPFGIYTFDTPGWVYEGEDLKAEFGGVWSPITPRFSTNRSEIGVHYDPSTFKRNHNVGTSGCFATPTANERNIMTKFIRTHKPKHFIFYEG
ncbi:MAG: SH3 domain-containing protein [Cyanobacteria bacterium J06635_10]